jgi:hypothetical protein
MYLKVTHLRLPKSIKDACLEILNELAKSSGHKISQEEANIIKNFESKVLIA